VIVVAAIVLAAVLVEVSALVDREALARFPRLFGAGAPGARSMLATIAGSIITVAGVTFSITVVAVAQASTQYTPRILRNFMRDRPNQIVLGVLAGVFVYCLVVLRTIRGSDELEFIPAIAVLVAVALAVVAIGFFVFFIHHIAETLESGSILARIGRETVEAVEHLFPEALGEEIANTASTPALTALQQLAWQPIPAATTGYVQGVDEDGLLAYAEKRGAVVRMERGIGEFVVAGTPLVSLAGRSANGDQAMEVNALFTVSSYRTVDQDAAYGIRQIVDIALKGLSPGVNDTTTAVSCVDHIGAVLTRLAPRRVAEPYRLAAGQLRVVAKGPSFESLLKASLDEIRQNAAGNVSVLARLLTMQEPLARLVTSEQRLALIRGHAELIRKTAARSIPLEEDRAEVDEAYTRLDQILTARTNEIRSADERRAVRPGLG
jgi:uncharacterized membrane protein